MMACTVRSVSATAAAMSSIRVRHGPPRSGRPMPAMARGGQAVTACLVSLLVTWMVRGLAASWTGMVRVSTPAA